MRPNLVVPQEYKTIVTDICLEVERIELKADLMRDIQAQFQSGYVAQVAYEYVTNMVLNFFFLVSVFEK